MPGARIVVVEHDGWVLRLLEGGLREHGFVVASATTASEGVERIVALAPDCVLCDVALTEHDGYWLATRIRAEGGVIALTPLVLLAAEEDTDARTRAFEAGADGLITRPFRIEEVVAQVQALVVLARRMRVQRTSLADSLGPPASPEAASFYGDLEQMGLASLLGLLELERRTGRVTVKTGSGTAKRRATFEVAAGTITEATLDGARCDVVKTLRQALGWANGRMSFRAAQHASPPSSARAIRALVAEARTGSRTMGRVVTSADVRSPVPRGASAQPPRGNVPMTSARPPAAEPPPASGRSDPGLPALRPPPGGRLGGSSARLPALTDAPTRKVDVPELPHDDKPPKPPSKGST
jgi:two-component system, OmpR family, response regulator